MSAEPEDEKPVNLSQGLISFSPSTLIRMMWVLMTGCVIGTFTVITAINSVHREIEEVGRKIDARTTDRWTRSMMREYVYKMRIGNPMLIEPDVDEIFMRLDPK